MVNDITTINMPLLLSLLLLLVVVHQITENPPEQHCATEFSMMICGSVSLRPIW